MAVAAAGAAATLTGGPLQQEQQHLAAEQQQSSRDGTHAPVWVPPVGRAGLYDAEGRLMLKALTLPELEAWCAAEDELAPANRALQIWRWMYADPPAGAWVKSLEETLGRQNGFSAKFLDKVGRRITLDGGLRLSQVVRAADGTRKLVFQVTQGEAAGGTVETVLIPIVRQQGLRDRLTICVSSQVGCAMNCQFCYTGRMGLLGNLSTAQIVEQVVEARRFLAEEGDRTQLTNLVFMGMGEPLHNTEAVLAASEVISHYLGLHISHNKVTISTVGLVPELRQVVARSRAQIALSLHATTDEVRDWIVPVNRRYDLASLVAALEELFPKPPAAGAVVSPSGGVPQASPPPEAVAQSRAVPHGPPMQSAGAPPSSQPAEQAQGSRSHLHPHAHAATGPEEESPAVGQEVRWLPPLGTLPPLSSSSSSSSQLAASPAERNPTEHLQQAPQTEQQPAAGAEVVVAAAAASCGGSIASLDAAAGSWADEGSSAELRGERIASGSRGASSSGSSSSERGGSGVGSGRSLLVEYTMLHGINDTLEDAERLVQLLSRVNCKVNLIVFNPHAGTRFRASRSEDVSAFRSLLVQRGMVCTIRDSRGDDEMAACGQLGNVGLSFRPSPILEAPERFRPFLLAPTVPPQAKQLTTV